MKTYIVSPVTFESLRDPIHPKHVTSLPLPGILFQRPPTHAVVVGGGGVGWRPSRMRRKLTGSITSRFSYGLRHNMCAEPKKQEQWTCSHCLVVISLRLCTLSTVEDRSEAKAATDPLICR